MFVCASYAWSSSKPTRFAAGPAAAVDDTTAAALESSPAYQAAKRSGEALPKLRALRQLLGVHDAAAVLHHPRFWSMPLEKDLLPRHAYQVSLGAPATTTWCTTAALEQLLLAKDAHFVEGLEREGLEGATPEGYADFAAAFRRGGIDAAREGRADLLELAISHGWDPNDERDVRGASALHYAAGHGHGSCVELLLRRGGLSVNDKASGDGAATPPARDGRGRGLGCVGPPSHAEPKSNPHPLPTQARRRCIGRWRVRVAVQTASARAAT